MIKIKNLYILNKDTSQYKENFIKNYNEKSGEGYFVDIDVQYLEKLHELHDNYRNTLL